MRFPPLLLLCCLLVIGGCGFHLRENPLIPADVTAMHVSAVNAFGDFVRQLRQELELLGVAPVSGDADAPWRLRISGERNTRRALTTTSLITVAEYELQLEVEFALSRRDGEELIPPTSLTARRIYVLDQTSLAGSSEEEELLKGEMQQELVRTILRRAGAVLTQLDRPGED